jgi:hypothetical protein
MALVTWPAPIRQSFGHGQIGSGDHNLIDGFGNLAGSDRPHMGDGFSHGFQDRQGLFKDHSLTSDHDGKGSVLCALRPSGHRRIQHADAFFSEHFSHTAGGGRIDGGHIHNDGTLRSAMDNAVISQDDAFNIRRIADTDNNDFRVRRSFFRRCCAFSPFCSQAFFFFPGSIVNSNFITRFENVHCHSDAHCSHTDECNLHGDPPL